jgi:polysaccharide biosynthesis protein PslG
MGMHRFSVVAVLAALALVGPPGRLLVASAQTEDDAAASTTADTANAAQTSGSGATDSPRSGFPYGILVADLGSAAAAHDAGFRVMSLTLSWRRVEPNRGQFPFEQQDQWGRPRANDLTNVLDAAHAHDLRFGMRVIDPPDWAGGSPNRVNPADLEDFVYHAVKYAGGTLAYVEVFNEPNLPGEWGGSPDPAAFARLQAGAYRGAKRANPGVPVINGGPAQRTSGRGGSMEDVDWLDGFYRAGGNQSVDALGVHAYLGSFDPGTDASCQPMCFREVEQFRDLMARYGDNRPMYIGEMGALEQTWGGIDLGQFNWMELPSNQRGEYLVKALRMANASYPWIIGATVFNLDHAAAGIPPSSEQFWFSMLNPDRSARPALNRFRQARSDGTLP